MKRVIERCPNCGVEHDDPKGGACEVCGTPLRFWCRVHSKEIGWLDAPACPRCAEEAARPAPPPHPAPAPPPRRPARTRVEADAPVRREPRPRPWGGRDAGTVVRDHAEDLAPYAAAGATMAVRMVRALFALVGSVIVWGLLGALGGVLYAQVMDMWQEVLWTALFGVMAGGLLGLAVGAIRALRILFAAPRRPDG